MTKLVQSAGDKRQNRFKRVILATHDAYEAREYVARAAAFPERAQQAREERVLLAALTAAFVVAYGRCFAGSQSRGNDLPNVGRDFVKTLSKPQRALHRRIIALRNQEFAHSDADVADMTVSADSPATLVATSRTLRLYSLTAADIDSALPLLGELLAFLTTEQLRLQEELAPTGGF